MLTVNKHCLLVFALLFLQHQILFAVELNTRQIEQTHKLDSLRNEIRNVESSIVTARSEAEKLYQEIELSEIAARDTSQRLDFYATEIRVKEKQLKELDKRKREQQSVLDQQRQQLATQVRAAYKSGRSNYLKLLLNQEDPAQMGRILAYYNYDVQARGNRIEKINKAVEELALLQNEIELETRATRQLQQEQKLKLAEFESFRTSRQAAREKLQAFISEQGTHLALLQANEEKLKGLVTELEQQQLAIEVFEEMPPFNSLRGKLEWPVKGKISSRFGSLRKGGKIKTHGVTIDASVGVEVRAISAGKVVFADWFRNMGLLLILDHGDGYMSLYGHNERLLKKSGDLVLAGESIARVGDTGGQQLPGLYFEIRQAGNPINPNLWCKN